MYQAIIFLAETTKFTMGKTLVIYNFTHKFEGTFEWCVVFMNLSPLYFYEFFFIFYLFNHCPVFFF